MDDGIVIHVASYIADMYLLLSMVLFYINTDLQTTYYDSLSIIT